MAIDELQKEEEQNNKAVAFWKDAKDFIVRNLITIVLSLAGLYILAFEPEFLKVIAGSVVLTLLASSLAGIVLKVFTKIDFVKTDNILAIALIYLGTCLLIGMFAGMYYFSILSGKTLV